jgi:hypothetical protein
VGVSVRTPCTKCSPRGLIRNREAFGIGSAIRSPSATPAVVQAAHSAGAQVLQPTYEAAARLAHWDREALERPFGTPGVPPALA